MRILEVPSFHNKYFGLLLSRAQTVLLFVLNFLHKCTMVLIARGISKGNKNVLSEAGFEPTHGEPDCDLNAAPYCGRP